MGKITATVQMQLQEVLEQNKSAPVWVQFRSSITSVLDSPISNTTSRGAFITAFVHQLELHSQRTQQAYQEKLRAHGISFTSFWIDNTLYIPQAPAFLVRQWSLDESIASMFIAPVLHIDVVTQTAPITEQGKNWGLQKIKVHKLWKKRIRGQGIRIGVIDTGVFLPHEALKHKMVSSYGWYDAFEQKSKPYDIGGHGTHVTAIAVGKKVGVAPRAKWMSCRACQNRICYMEKLKKCAQFMLCPTNAAGNNRDCSQAPRIVSNSWGGGSNSRFQDAVNAWRKAGIIPVFAAGNYGPGCRTVSSPGDYHNVIAAGSSTKSNTVSSFSSRGTQNLDIIKPDVLAPGSSILSASHSQATGYTRKSGTSMAAPHVSGLIALMLQAYPHFQYDHVLGLLQSTASHQLSRPQGKCGPISWKEFPNHIFGAGLIQSFG